MRLLEFAFLADENVDPRVITWLKDSGVDIVSAADCGLLGGTDRQILQESTDQSRVVLTYDSDFGALAIRDGEDCFGIVFVRPGNLRADQFVTMVRAADRKIPSLDPPFLLLLELKDNATRMRLRRFEPADGR